MRITNQTLTLLLGASLFGCATEPTAPPAAPKPAAAPAAAPAAPPGPPAAPARQLSKMDAAVLAGNCFTCHGPNGHSPGTIPSIDTLGKKRLVSDMMDFRSGEVPSTVMGRQAKGFSDVEIEVIADYISGLKKR
jgi:cytochrome subunit of sulfide dehydrogenase